MCPFSNLLNQSDLTAPNPEMPWNVDAPLCELMVTPQTTVPIGIGIKGIKDFLEVLSMDYWHS